MNIQASTNEHLYIKLPGSSTINVVDILTNNSSGKVYIQGIGNYLGNETIGIDIQDLAAVINDKASVSALDSYLPKSGGTMTGDITMGNNTVTGLPTPSNNTDAATKKYVDDLVANATHYKGDFNASTGVITGGSSTLTAVAEKIGDMYVVSTAGTYCGTALEVGDSIIFKHDVAAGTAPVAADLTFVEGTVSVTDESPTLSWGTTSTVGIVEGVALQVTMPANPNTDTNTAQLQISDTTTKKINTAETPTSYIQFEAGTNKFTVKDNSGTSFEVAITPSITDNVTGSGTSSYLTKWSGAYTLENGPQLGSSTTSFLRNDGEWETPVDNKTLLEVTTTSNYRPLIAANKSVSNEVPTNTESITDEVYFTNKAFVQPSTGNIYSAGYVGVGKTALNTGCNMVYNAITKSVNFEF